MKTCEKIKGGRIFLEILSQENSVSDYSKWMQDEEVLRFLTGRTRAYSKEELRNYITQMNESPADYLFGIFLSEGNTHIGNIKVGGIDSLKKWAHVGLLIGNKSLWGKGYATEAIKLVTQFAFESLNIHTLAAGMVAGNVGSYNAFINAGYKEDEKQRERILLNGEYVDAIMLEKYATLEG